MNQPIIFFPDPGPSTMSAFEGSLVTRVEAVWYNSALVTQPWVPYYHFDHADQFRQHIHMSIKLNTHTHTRTRTCMYIYIYDICVHMVCIYIYIMGKSPASLAWCSTKKTAACGGCFSSHWRGLMGGTTNQYIIEQYTNNCQIYNSQIIRDTLS